MASRRIAAATVDWAAFAKNVPAAQKPQFHAFKAKSDAYAIKVAALPSSLPTINWAQYEGHVVVPGMVAEFKKQYEAVSISFPKDTYSNLVDEQQKQAVSGVEAYVKESMVNITTLKAELAHIEAVMPVQDMNMEEYFDAFPNKALDPFDRPTMWPHIEEVQPEYLEQMEKDGKFEEEH